MAPRVGCLLLQWRSGKSCAPVPRAWVEVSPGDGCREYYCSIIRGRIPWVLYSSGSSPFLGLLPSSNLPFISLISTGNLLVLFFFFSGKRVLGIHASLELTQQGMTLQFYTPFTLVLGSQVRPTVTGLYHTAEPRALCGLQKLYQLSLPPHP